jgi:hypothetical protein
MKIMERIVSNESRFWEYVEKTSYCWLWGAHTDAAGYGRFGLRMGPKNWKRNYLAHRYSYELAYGGVPDGLVVHHKCGVRSCVNPSHLEAITQSENASAKNRRLYLNKVVH